MHVGHKEMANGHSLCHSKEQCMPLAIVAGITLHEQEGGIQEIELQVANSSRLAGEGIVYGPDERPMKQKQQLYPMNQKRHLN